MAKVTITIEDGEDDNSVNMKIESDPAWPTDPRQSMTLAQSAGISFFDWMNTLHSDSKPS